ESSQVGGVSLAGPGRSRRWRSAGARPDPLNIPVVGICLIGKAIPSGSLLQGHRCLISTVGLLSGALPLTAGGPTASATDQGQAESSSTNTSTSAENGMDHSTMDHPMDGGPAPEGIREAESPKHPVGSTVTLTADHMEGMNGAKATIAGAYDTYTYAVNFTPTTGGDPVADHKWVVQEEITDAGDQRLANGSEVRLEADHMKGMKDAKATIASSTDETVYMVDYVSDG